MDSEEVVPKKVLTRYRNAAIKPKHTVASKISKPKIEVLEGSGSRYSWARYKSPSAGGENSKFNYKLEDFKPTIYNWRNDCWEKRKYNMSFNKPQPVGRVITFKNKSYRVLKRNK